VITAHSFKTCKRIAVAGVVLKFMIYKLQLRFALAAWQKGFSGICMLPFRPIGSVGRSFTVPVLNHFSSTVILICNFTNFTHTFHGLGH
jgi:hypothetical protein